ncbi:MAG: PorV/PorQ family protein [Elusimicrobiota bacterium]
MRARRLLALACLAGLAPAAAHCGAGSSSFPFLKLPAGARSAALGGASAALLDDAFSVFSNPAAAAASPFSEVSLSHNAWAEGLGQETAAITLRRGPWGFGAGANMLLGGGLDGYGPLGEAAESFDYSESAFLVSAARSLSGKFYAGAALKPLYQSAGTESAFGVSGDIGILYAAGPLRLAAAARNLGPDFKLYKEGFPLPANYAAAGSWRWRFGLAAACEAGVFGDSGWYAAAGAELPLKLSPSEEVFFRAGYRFSDADQAGSGFSAGGGVALSRLRVDYALTPLGAFGGAHRVSVSYRFSAFKEPEKPVYGRPAWREPSRPAARPSERPATKPAPKKDQKDEIFLLW